MMEGFWEYWITQFVLTVVRPGMVVMDVGANFGYYSLPVSQTSSDPLASALRSSRTRWWQNIWTRRSGSTALPSVAPCMPSPWGERKERPAFMYPRMISVEPSVCTGEDGPGVVRVPLMALDRICEGVQRLDFLKIDAEGSEPAIIDGAAATIARLRPSLLLEFSVHNGDRSLLDRLASIYGQPRVVDYDGAAKSVSIEALFERQSAHPHMIYFS